MITQEKISELIDLYLAENSLFLVEIKISQENDITVTVESMEQVTINNCVDISKIIEAGLNREEEDFSLTVTSSGLDTPFKVLKQYQKFYGKEVDIVLKKGSKFTATLLDANDQQLKISRTITIKEEGKKNRTTKEVIESLPLSEIKSTKATIKF